GDWFADGCFKERPPATTTDFKRGWGKIWLQNLTLAANRPRIRQQYAKAASTVRKLHERQVRDMLQSLDLSETDYPPEAIVTLLDAITSKLILDRLVGITTGHRSLLRMLR